MRFYYLQNTSGSVVKGIAISAKARVLLNFHCILCSTFFLLGIAIIHAHFMTFKTA